MPLPRVLTALLGIPLLLFFIHWGGLTFSLFVVTVAVLSLYEYGMILRLGGKPVQRFNAVAGGGLLAACSALKGPLSLAVCLLLSAVLLQEMFSREHCLDRAAATLFGALLLGWMPAHMALIRDIRPYGENLAFMVFVAIWAMDCAAYAAGAGLGRRKLAPILSPKKTWEGAVAGFAAALATVAVFRLFFPGMVSAPKALVLGALIGVAGQLSDLGESLIKRAVGAKDSGKLIPGHGGVMDRFDSFILCAPAVYYCLVLL